MASLTARRLIVVSDVAGQPLTTARTRRFTRSRIYYGLHPDVLAVIMPKSEVVNFQESAKDTDFPESCRDFPSHEARKANGTKENGTTETLTKEIVAEVFFENRIGQSLQTYLDPDTERVEPSDPEVVRFIEHYQKRFKEHIGDASPPASWQDQQRLRVLLATHSFESLAELLETFFFRGFAYIQRQGYSLSLFLHSIHILQMAKPKSKNTGGSK